MILFDADVLIDYLKRRGPENGAVRRAITTGELGLSAVTAYELYFGDPVGPGRQLLDSLLDRATIFPLTQRSAEFAALRGRALSDAGEKLAAPDLLIAGTALELGLPLVTRNVRHFGRIEGLEVLDPN